MQKTGLNIVSLQDGTSKVPMICESREETFTSWYSGLLRMWSAAWPQQDCRPANGATPVALPTARFTGYAPARAIMRSTRVIRRATSTTRSITCVRTSIRTALLNRNWGPSSRHPGVVIHGYGDGHTEGVNDTIDPTAYIQQVTRGGREVGNP